MNNNNFEIQSLLKEYKPILVPFNIENALPPSFCFTMLSLTRFREKNVHFGVIDTDQLKVLNLLSMEIKMILQGIVNFEFMKDLDRVKYIIACKNCLIQPYCEHCLKEIDSISANLNFKEFLLKNPVDFSGKIYPREGISSSQCVACPVCMVSRFCCKAHYEVNKDIHKLICFSLKKLNSIETEDIYHMLHITDDLSVDYTVIANFILRHEKFVIEVSIIYNLEI
jgi:hypothetical protein